MERVAPDRIVAGTPRSGLGQPGTVVLLAELQPPTSIKTALERLSPSQGRVVGRPPRIVFTLRKPPRELVERYRTDCGMRPLSFPGLCVASLAAPPRGFVLDEYGCVLGSGEASFRAAEAALDRFAMYPSPWAWVQAGTGCFGEGSVYVAVIRAYGLYALLPGRVLERLDETEPVRRYGFTFATVAGHVEHGVERFEIVCSPETGEVRFVATAVSRPGALVRWVSPLARRLQRKFHRESPQVMRAASAGQDGNRSTSSPAGSV